MASKQWWIDTVKSHTLEVLLQLAQLVDKERSQTSPTLWPLTTHLQLAVKRTMAFFQHVPKTNNPAKKKKKKSTRTTSHLWRVSLASFPDPFRVSHPQPHSPQGHILRFEDPPSFSLSWAHPSAVAAQRNASRLAVNPGPSGGLPRPPAAVHHPFQLGLGLCLGVRKICPI